MNMQATSLKIDRKWDDIGIAGAPSSIERAFRDFLTWSAGKPSRLELVLKRIAGATERFAATLGAPEVETVLTEDQYGLPECSVAALWALLRSLHAENAERDYLRELLLEFEGRPKTLALEGVAYLAFVMETIYGWRVTAGGLTEGSVSRYT